MWIYFLTLVFATAVLGAPAKKKHGVEETSYEGHKVVTVNAQTAEHVEILRLIQDGGNYVLDFFSHPHLGHVDIRIPPKDFSKLWSVFTFSGLQPRVKVENLQTLVDEDVKQRKRSRAGKACLSHTSCYFTLDSIISFVKNLETEFPDRVKMMSSGTYTYNGNEMWAVHISKDFNTKREAVIVEALTHAREWVTGSVALDLMNRLAREYGRDPDVTYMLDTFDWYIIPVHNPDGYVHSHTSSRMWRKNRQPVEWNCYGVDLNRNWDVNHAGVGSSANCFAETFHGKNPFSEVETTYLRDLFFTIGNVKGFLSLHCYSQMLFIPYGYSVNLNYADKAELRTIAENAAHAIQEVDNRRFQVGTPGEILYEASGGAYDYFKQEGVQYSFTYELRPGQDEQDVGFLLPDSQIDAAVRETWASFVVFARAFK